MSDKEKKKVKKTPKQKKKAASKKKPAQEKKAAIAKTEQETKPSKPEIAKKPAPKKTKKVKKPKKEKTKVIVSRGKRKESIARATIRSGKGVVRVNSILLDSFGNRYVRAIIREPLRYIGPEANSVNIYVNVFGGGAMGQAQAARTAIANALLKYFEDMNLKEKFISIDRSLVVEDTRRVEPKKYKGPKARARYQKSYR